MFRAQKQQESYWWAELLSILYLELIANKTWMRGVSKAEKSFNQQKKNICILWRITWRPSPRQQPTMSLQGYNEYMERSHRDNAITVVSCLGQQTLFLGNVRERIVRSVKWTEGQLHSNGRGYKSPASTRNGSSLALTAEENTRDLAAIRDSWIVKWW
jgi:hypothetical protein